MDHIIEAIAAAEQDCRQIVSNGTICNDGWDDDGYPIGGRLTWDAVGEINGIAHSIAAYGIPYRDARMIVMGGSM